MRKPVADVSFRVCIAAACAAIAVVGAAWLAARAYADAATPQCLSPLALVADKDGKTLYVTEATARQVAVFDIASGKAKTAIPVPEQPTGLALAPDGGLLYVSCAAPRSSVCALDMANRKTSFTLPAGHTSTAPVLSPDGKTLYVCNRFNNDVSVFDLATRKEVKRIAVDREPVAAAITSDGKYLFVANHLPSGPADGDYTASKVTVIDTEAQKVAASIALPDGSTGLRGVCVSPDGKYAYVTHLLSRYHLPTTQLERGWMNTNAVSVIGVAELKLLNTVLLDDVDRGAANPWGIACTADGKYVCVAHAGTHEVSVIDAAGLIEKLAKAPSPAPAAPGAGDGGYVAGTQWGSSVTDVPNDLSFLVGLRRRIKLTGSGPRGIAIVGSKAYVAEYFTDSIGVADLTPSAYPRVESQGLGSAKDMTAVRKGEMLFNDASICFQGWQSCASCHPEGRTDGLNWDLLNDGMGNPKNTKSMLLAHKTPPSMVSGIRDKAETAVRAGIKFILFAVRPEDDAAAVDEYLKSLQPVPSPYLADGRLSKAAERGKELFQSAGCASCHTGPLCTNLKGYDVGTGSGMEADRVFDTPTLVEVWRTAPYLYDGRAATVKDVLITHDLKDKHGSTSHLTDRQISDLAEFVLSL